MTPFLRRLVFIAWALCLGACTTYQYQPPESDAGRQCVTTCDTNRQICIAGKEQAAASQAQSCEMRRSAQLNNCLRMALTREARAYCNKVAPHCSQGSAMTGACEQGYRSCYVQCGGRVIEVKS